MLMLRQYVPSPSSSFRILSLSITLALLSLFLTFNCPGSPRTLVHICCPKRSASCSAHTRGTPLMSAQQHGFSASVLHPFKAKTFPLGTSFDTTVSPRLHQLLMVHSPIWCLMESILRGNLLWQIPRNSWCSGRELERQSWIAPAKIHHLSKIGMNNNLTPSRTIKNIHLTRVPLNAKCTYLL